MQKSDDLLNLVIAIVLSTVVLLGWQYFYAVPQQEVAQEQRAKAVAEQEQFIAKVASPQALAQSRTEVVAASVRLPIKSDKLVGSIALTGARIDDLTLTNYKQTQDAGSPDVVLLTPSGLKDSYFMEMGWMSKSATVPSNSTVWQTNSTSLTPESPATLFWDNGQGLRFERVISLDANYMFSVKDRVVNQSGNAVNVTPYGYINRTYTQDANQFIILHEGLIGAPDGTLHEFTYSDLKDDEQKHTFNNASGWMGITDKYWLTALAPQGESFTSTFQHYQISGQDRFQSDYLGVMRTVATGGDTVLTTQFFAGAKKLSLLDDYSEQYDIPLFDRAVDFGVLYFLTKPLFLALDFFYKLLGNFGLGILALTVIVKALLFPIANKSYHSMAQMRELMPEITKLRERFADDKMQMNQEMMGLYKRKKVSPASGCLPMLIQLPIFFALYKVLFVTIEMRHAPFYGWVKDLSMPDPTNLFTLFGLIDWNAPSLLHVGILPLAMAISMALQQQLNPKPADATQALVMKWMPWMFLFLFAGFPAGLVLYWVWSNVLSILQQWVITRRYENRHGKKDA